MRIKLAWEEFWWFLLPLSISLLLNILFSSLTHFYISDIYISVQDKPFSPLSALSNSLTYILLMAWLPHLLFATICFRELFYLYKRKDKIHYLLALSIFGIIHAILYLKLEWYQLSNRPNGITLYPPLSGPPEISFGTIQSIDPRLLWFFLIAESGVLLTILLFKLRGRYKNRQVS